jgi:hypothetical protein
MKRLDCSEAEKLIVFDLDEGLDLENKERLESHLQACASCIKAREQFRVLFSSVATDVPPDPGDEFWRHYDYTLAAAIREKETDAGWWGLRWKMAGGLLAAVLAIAAVFTSLYDFERKTIVEQPGVEKLVIQELNELYGPSSDEISSTLRDSAVLTEAKTSRGDDTVFEWFEVEDENSNFLL